MGTVEGGVFVRSSFFSFCLSSVRSKYGPREPRQGSGSPPHQRREVAAQEARAESSPTQQTR